TLVRSDVVAGGAPAAPRLPVAQPQFVGEAEFDAGHAEGDLAGDELGAAPGRLVVEQDAGDGEHAVRLAVVLGEEVPVRLGDPVRRAGVEAGALVLRRLADLAEHLGRGGLVEADLPAGRPPAA